MNDEPHRVLVLAGKSRVDLFGDIRVCSGYILYCRKQFRANVARQCRRPGGNHFLGATAVSQTPALQENHRVKSNSLAG